jgi:hypothetical protein
MREEAGVIAVRIDFRWRSLARLLIVCSFMLIPFKGFAQSPAVTVKWFAGNGYPPGPYSSPEEVCAIRNGSMVNESAGYGVGAIGTYSDGRPGSHWEGEPTGGYPGSQGYCTYTITITGCDAGLDCTAAEQDVNALPTTNAELPPGTCPTATCPVSPKDVRTPCPVVMCVVILNQYITQHYPDIDRRGDYKFGTLSNPRAVASTAALTGVTILPSYLRCKTLNEAEFKELFESMLHQSMHSTDPWWTVLWDALWGDDHPTANQNSINNRVNYETHMGHKFIPGPMWGTPTSFIPDLTTLYKNSRERGNEVPRDCN